MRGRSTQAAAIAAAALLAQVLPVAAQSGSYDAQACRYVRGQMVCSNANRSRGAPGTHAYDQWSNGSPAIGGGASSGSYQFPQYLGGHSAWYGFGR